MNISSGECNNSWCNRRHRSECKYWAKGWCKREHKCEFLHQQLKSQSIRIGQNRSQERVINKYPHCIKKEEMKVTEETEISEVTA